MYTDDIEVKWFKGDNERDPSETVKIEKDGFQRQLTIETARMTDAGIYCVKARNAKMEFTVTVKGDIFTFEASKEFKFLLMLPWYQYFGIIKKNIEIFKWVYDKHKRPCEKNPIVLHILLYDMYEVFMLL